MPHDVICLGEVMVELSLNDATPDTAGIGFAGDTFNTSIYLKRRAPGLSVAYATKLGRDKLSDRIVALMEREDLATDLVLRSPDRMPGLYAISTDDRGERSFLYWRDRAAVRTLFEPPALDMTALTGTAMLYLSAITLAILTPDDRNRLIDGLAALQASGTKIAFDSNYRPALWPDRATAQAEIERAWRMADIGLPSLDDEMALYGDGDDSAVLARLNGWGVTDGALKRGAEGPVALDGTAAPACAPAPKVIDSTAAGDSFNGGYLAARLTGAAAPDALKAGHDLAALVVQHRGAIMPRGAMGDGQ
jgi:2-dehydro-3-deoxygluconokinase